MPFKRPLPSPGELRHLFTADYDEGRLYWRNPRSARCKIGDPVYLKKNACGHLRLTVRIEGRDANIFVHRIIWAMYHGTDPLDLDIDHIDQDKTNNAISNLRLATRSENKHNLHRRGFKRDSYYRNKPCSAGGWEARINIDKKQVYLGQFSCPLLARLAYVDAKRTVALQFSPI